MEGLPPGIWKPGFLFGIRCSERDVIQRGIGPVWEVGLFVESIPSAGVSERWGFFATLFHDTLVCWRGQVVEGRKTILSPLVLATRTDVLVPCILAMKAARSVHRRSGGEESATFSSIERSWSVHLCLHIPFFASSYAPFFHPLPLPPCPHPHPQTQVNNRSSILLRAGEPCSRLFPLPLPRVPGPTNPPPPPQTRRTRPAPARRGSRQSCPGGPGRCRGSRCRRGGARCGFGRCGRRWGSCGGGWVLERWESGRVGEREMVSEGGKSMRGGGKGWGGLRG